MAHDPDNPSNSSLDEGTSKCPFQFNVSDLWCNSTYDGILCWPATKAGHVAVIPCMEEFNNVKYDVTGNASRTCLPNGTWANSNYLTCPAIRDITLQDIVGKDWETPWITKIIYITGYSLSLVALVIALSIFFCFKDLRCQKNTFHANLMLTYVLVNCTWILIVVSHRALAGNQWGTCILVIFLYYFKGTNFFWMFVEAFYLYLLVVRTFFVEKVKFYVYMLIGWGAPAVVVGTWIVVKAQLVGENLQDQPTLGDTTTGCPWIEAHNYDYIFIGPMLFILSINFLFLILIMWVLITKLRVTTSAESQQYRKAAKALLVLIPLLGVTYILVIKSPSGAAFLFIRAILISTQGFAVSVLYCFLNGEVRNSIRHHWERWRDSRSIGYPSRHSARCGDGGASIAPPGECQRLYDSSAVDQCRTAFALKERGSCVSEMTDNSFVSTNGCSPNGNNSTANKHCKINKTFVKLEIE